MCKFKIGQKIVALFSSENCFMDKLVKGQIYTCKGFRECECGRVTIDIGFKVPPDYINGCKKCDKAYTSSSMNILQEAFAPLDNIEEKIKYKTVVVEICPKVKRLTELEQFN